MLGLLETAGQLVLLLLSAFRWILTRRWRVRMILVQMEQIGIQSLPIALLTATFTGMVLVLQTGVQLQQLGAKSLASGIAAIALCREIGPVLTSIVLAGRVGAGITAEIGTMKVTEQIDAMRSLATDPVDYLVTPRLIAAIVMLPAITVLADFVGLAGGMIVGVNTLGLSCRQYIDTTFEWLSYRDYVTGIIKTFVFGVIIAIVGCHFGFNSQGGAEGVGQATTRSVVMSSILILIANYFLAEWIIRIWTI
jgi:phospholipid/cholesterol/gamma-HCH transport system permease protein